MHPLDDEDAPRFAVGQVAEMLDVQPAFVRRLDSEEVVQPARSPGGQRRYSRADIDQVRRVAEMADALHFGTWGGITSKIVWFAFGLLLTALPVTGAIVYSLRLDAAARETAILPRQGALGRWVRGMGAWAYVAGALIANGLVMAPLAWLG